MLKSVEIANFKSHNETKINFGNFTILCGNNGVGKSSVIQMLLLLRESFIKDRTLDYLDLKSNSVKIGTVNDAIFEFGEYDGFKTTLHFDNDVNLKLFYEAKSESDKSKSFIDLHRDYYRYKTSIESLSAQSLFNTNFQYISASRFGPLDKYDKDDKIVDVYKQISVIEGKAEYFIHFLEKNKNMDILEELCFKNDDSQFKDLYTQVLLWEKYIFDGANTEIVDIGKLGYELKYSFENFRSSTKKTQGYDAKNVGYGLSYTLPIIVSILSAQRDALIIIENPEAHLHPKAISKLIELICLACQAGIQIIIETHSDHIINGTIVHSVKRQSDSKIGIDMNLVKIYQFYRSEENNSTKVEQIEILENGQLSKNPKDFFDQIQLDLAQILGF